ncbi:MAG TPA: pilin [Candidatus Paceibacterota bacterium]
MQFLKTNLGTVIFILFFVLLPVVSLAQSGSPGGQTIPGNPRGQTIPGNAQGCIPSGGTICNPIDSDTIQEFIQKILEGALRVGIPLIALAIIYSGFLFVSARGNSEKLTKAKDALLYTLIGAAILLGSWAIAELISATVLSL